VLFLIKVAAGFAVWAIYTYYYTYRPTADVFRYFDASEVLFNIIKTNPEHFFKILFGIKNEGPEFFTYYDQMNVWLREVDSSSYNDNRLIIRINTVIRFFSFGYFHIHTVFFSAFSFIGLTALYKVFSHVVDFKKGLIAVLFLIPSVLFWGSGVLKEGIIILALGLLFYNCHELNSNNQKRVLRGFICLLCLATIAVLKFYILLCLIPAAVFVVITHITGNKQLLIKFLGVMIVTLILGFNIHKLSPLPNMLEMLAHKQQDFISLAQGNERDPYGKPIPPAGSIVDVQVLEPNIYSFLKSIPQALNNAMFKPYLWQSKSVIIAFSAIENILVWLFILVCIVFAKPLNKMHLNYILFCFAFAFAQLIIIGITTPVMGAIVRYKVIALPFLLIGFLMILDTDKLKHLFKNS
jgi:hypothetical protein